MERDRHRLNRLPGWFRFGTVAPPVALLGVFYAWPLATVIGRGSAALGDTLSRRNTWAVTWFTLWQALVSTAITLVAGLPAAWAVARFTFPGRQALLALLTAVFVLPTVVVGAAFAALLPGTHERGLWAVLGAHVVFNLAVVVRVVGTAWEQLPPAIGEAAASVGASPLNAFRYVTLPLLRPAILSAATIVFLFCFTSFGVIRVLGTPGTTTLEVEVWRQATQLGQIGTAATLTVLQIAALLAVVGGSAWWQRRHMFPIALDPQSRRPRPRSGERLPVAAAACLTALAVAVPLAALVERSLRTRDGYGLAAWRGLGRNEVRPGLSLGIDPIGALRQSATVAGAATALAVAVGALAAVAVTTTRRGSRLLDVGLMLPLGTSAVTIGLGMLITFDRAPADWRAEWWLVPVGHALVAVPFVVRACVAVLRQVDPALGEAATVLGASPARAWATSSLPYLWRPLASAAGLAAATSLGEFGATSFLSRSGRETLPITIERLLGRTGQTFQAQAYALAVVLAAATIAIVAACDALGRAGRRRQRAGG